VPLHRNEDVWGDVLLLITLDIGESELADYEWIEMEEGNVTVSGSFHRTDQHLWLRGGRSWIVGRCIRSANTPVLDDGRCNAHVPSLQREHKNSKADSCPDPPRKLLE
jgi:hypothetical protein